MSEESSVGTKHISGFQQERLLEAWLMKNGYPEVDRRKGATGIVAIERADGKQNIFSQKRDIFGCIDLVAMGEDIWMIQATTHGGSSHRRKKVEKRKWPIGLVKNGTLRISIFTHSATQDPNDLRKWLHRWHVQDLKYDANPITERSCFWTEWRDIPFDIKELEVEKREVSEDDKAEAARIVALPPEEKLAAIKALKKARRKGKKT